MAAGRKTDYTAPFGTMDRFNKHHFSLFSPDRNGNPSAPGPVQKIEADSGNSFQKNKPRNKIKAKVIPNRKNRQKSS